MSSELHYISAITLNDVGFFKKISKCNIIAINYSVNVV